MPDDQGGGSADPAAAPLHVLVAGATGFIGSHLLRGGGASFRFTAITRDGAAPPGAHAAARWDLRDRLDPAALPDRVDAVLHLAQSNRYREFPAGADDVVRVNVASALALAEWAIARGCPHFVYASSPGFNTALGVAAADDAPIAAESFYLRTKATIEALLGEARFPGTLTLLRPYTPYGPGQRDRLIPNLAARVAAGRPVVLEGDPQGLLLSPIHVRDAVRAICAVLRKRCAGFVNLAGDEVVSVRDVAEMAGALCGRPPVFEIGRDAAKRALFGSNHRMKSLLDAPTLVPFATGLAEVVEARKSAP